MAASVVLLPLPAGELHFLLEQRLAQFGRALGRRVHVQLGRVGKIRQGHVQLRQCVVLHGRAELILDDQVTLRDGAASEDLALIPLHIHQREWGGITQIHIPFHGTGMSAYRCFKFTVSQHVNSLTNLTGYHRVTCFDYINAQLI